MLLTTAVAAVLLTATAHAHEKVVPVHVPEGHLDEPLEPETRSVTALVAKGDAAFKAGKLYDADKYYRHALTINDQVAEAVEGLAEVSRRRGEGPEAVRLLRKALGLVPAGRLGRLEEHIGEFCLEQKNWTEAEEAYRAAVAHGAPVFSSRYGLGLALYKQRRFREAEFWLREAAKNERQATPEDTRAKVALLHLLLAEAYQALSFPRYAIAEANDALGSGGGDEVQRTARKLEDGLDQPFRRLVFGWGLEYDTNVLPPYNTVVNLNGAPATGGGAMDARFELILRSSPARRWTYGLNVPLSGNKHYATGLINQDMLTAAPTAWLAWWNLKNLEAKLFYDYNGAWLDGNSYTMALQSHGPAVTFRFFPDKRHELDVGYSFRTVYFPHDPSETPNRFNQQSGQEQRAFVRLAFAGPNPLIQPFVQYTFDDNFARGHNFYALINLVEAGFTTWLGESRSRLVGSLGYAHVGFPEYRLRPADRVVRGRLALELALSNSFSAQLEGDYTHSDSDLSGVFSYNRFVVTSGLTYSLPF